MSVRGKQVVPEIGEDSHERLRIMAELKGESLSTTAARLLEKAIAGEWHEVSVVVDRMRRSGILRNAAEDGGKVR